MYLFLEHAGETGLAQTARAVKYWQCACAPGKDASIAGTTKKKKKNWVLSASLKKKSFYLNSLLRFSVRPTVSSRFLYSFYSFYSLAAKKSHFQKKKKKTYADG